MDLGTIIQFYGGVGEKVFDAYVLVSRPLLDSFHAFFDSAFYVLLFIAIVLSAFYILMSAYAVFNRKKAEERSFIAGRAPAVTVQIPTFNELAALRCAKACLDFDYPKEKLQIIIGDDSNQKEISGRIDAFAAEHGLTVTRRGPNIGYKAGNLNHMLKNSTGDILVIFDSDFVPEKDFLQRLVAPFIHDKGLSAVQARWSFLNRNQNFATVLGSTIVSVFHYICLPFLQRQSKVSFLCGSAEAVRKKDVLALGEWESGSLTEDIEYSLRLLKSGKRILYLDTLECAGEVPQTAKNLSFKDKSYISVFCSGYLLSFLLLLLFATGTLSFLTDRPAPIDVIRFLSEMGANILLPSGIIVASLVALSLSKNLRKALQMALASFSVGLMVTYYVNVGIIKVLFNQPMQWFMLSKEGNKI